MKLAKEYNLKTIAFPAISTGVYNYPKLEAGQIATKAVMDFIDKEDYIEEVNFVLFSEDNYLLYKKILDEKLNELE